MSDARASMYVDGKTRLFGVYGHPIGHTFSPKIHELLIQEYGENMAYAAYHVLPEHLGEALKGAWAMNIQGLNLTIPHKELALPYLVGISPEARQVGAVNTLKWTPEGYYGYNTDVYGMQQQLRTNGMMLEGQRVLILGAGGAARSAVMVCVLEGASEILVYNRNRGRAEEMLRHFSEVCEKMPAMRVVSHEELLTTEHPYVIQTTPAGMLNVSDPLPIADESFYQGIRYGADAVFNPKDTPFLKKVRAQGGVGISGLPMLFYQAVRAFEIWNEMEFPAGPREAAKEKFLAWAEEYFA